MTGVYGFKRLIGESCAATAVEYGVLGGVLALVLGSLLIHLGGRLSFTLALISHGMTALRAVN